MQREVYMICKEIHLGTHKCIIKKKKIHPTHADPDPMAQTHCCGYWGGTPDDGNYKRPDLSNTVLKKVQFATIAID
jgi:hypothetical protein